MGEKRCLTPLGVACKKRMVEKNISQTELAQKVGTSTKYLDLIFHGERAGKKYISRIVRELDINPNNIDKSIA